MLLVDSFIGDRTRWLQDLDRAKSDSFTILVQKKELFKDYEVIELWVYLYTNDF